MRKNSDTQPFITALAATACLAVLLGLVPGSSAPALSQQKNVPAFPAKAFDHEVASYLDGELQAALQELIRRERLLLALVRNVTAEIDNRGVWPVPGMSTTRGGPDSETLISSYDSELQKLSRLDREIDRLRRLAQDRNELDLMVPLNNLQEHLLEVIDRSRRRKFAETGAIQKLIDDYDQEVDALLAVAERLRLLEENHSPSTSAWVQESITEQRRHISETFDRFVPEVADTTSRAYALELERIDTILAEINRLLPVAHKHNLKLEGALSRLRDHLLASVDSQLAATLASESPEQSIPAKSAAPAENFASWKDRQELRYQMIFGQYRHLKETLLAAATPNEMKRMLARDFADALQSYAASELRLSEAQLSWIMNDYAGHFQLTNARYIRAQCYYHLGRYDSAQADYEKVAQAPASRFAAASLFRLMRIAAKKRQPARVAHWFEQFQTLTETPSPGIVEKARLLAGYAFLQTGEYERASQSLQAIPEASPNAGAALYLAAIARCGQHDLKAASDMLQSFVEAAGPTGRQSRLVREALLKLAYIAYETKDYESSLTYFRRVGRGSTRDRSEIGAAWARYQLGQYRQALDATTAFAKSRPASSLTYEALVLAAQAHRQLQDDDAALNALSRVADAQQVFDISAKLNVERAKIARQVNAFSQLERVALQRHDATAYAEILQHRERLEALLESFPYSGRIDANLLEDFAEERREILDQLDAFDKLAERANKKGLANVGRQAAKERARLLKALETYQTDLRIQHKHFFADYPNTVREMEETYRDHFSTWLLSESEQEQRRLKRDLLLLDQLRASVGATGKRIDLARLALLSGTLSRLQGDNEVFRGRLIDNAVQSPGHEEFDRWANISGVGISDITMKRIQESDDQLSGLAYNTAAIDKIITRRKDFLHQRVEAYDELIEELETELQIERADQLREKKERYFRENYFETEERETPAATDSEHGNGPEAENK